MFFAPYNNASMNLATAPLVTIMESKEEFGGEKLSNVGFGGGTEVIRFGAGKVQELRDEIESFNRCGGRYYWLFSNIAINLDVVTAVTITDKNLVVMYPGGTWKSGAREDEKEVYANYVEAAKSGRGPGAPRAAGEKTGDKAVDAKKAKASYKVKDSELEGLLATWGRDLTGEAREGRLQPITGRDEETAQVEAVLLQKEKGNPILLGEAGVGKTALVEGLAQKIAAGKAPEALKDARVIQLNLAAMDNTKWKGEFQGKLFPLLDGVLERNMNGEKILLFVDELHAGMKAGRAEGVPAVADYLKPYLTHPEFRLIGATTEGEYYEHISRDEALNRRFLPVHVGEPGRDGTLHILEARRASYEAHYKVGVPEAALELVYDLTQTLQPNLQQPDKSISVLDNACSRAAMAGASRLETDHVLEAAAGLIGMPKDFLKPGGKDRYGALETDLGGTVLGQESALAEVAALVRRGAARLDDPEKPLGSVLINGPKGTGKTTTGLALAELLCGGKENAVCLDLSLFSEPFTAMQKLLGQSTTVAGNGREGELTGPVRRKPYSTVIFDNIDRAHPEVRALVTKLLDTGTVTDAAGKKVSFRNSLVVLTAGEAGDPEMEAHVAGAVSYAPLTPEACAAVAARECELLKERLAKEWKAGLEVDPASFRRIAEDNVDPQQNARAIKKAFARAVATPLAAWVMEHLSLADRFAAAANDNRRVILAEPVPAGGFTFKLKETTPVPGLSL